MSGPGRGGHGPRRTRRERRLVVALGATLALLLAGIALVLREERAERRGTLAGTAQGIARVAIERPGRVAIALERRDGDWRIVAPCALDALDARIEPLLAALAGARPDYAAAEVDLAAAGLLEPRATVTLDGEPILLGATDLGGERRYARRGRRVALVPAWTLSLLEGGLSALGELAPFATAPRALRRLAPRPATLDPAPWAGLAANRIVTWPPADAPPATRRARLEAELDDGTVRQLELVGNASWTALRVDAGNCARLFAPDTLPSDTF